ncbi:hypothetical protein [Kocuria sp. HSID16901]|uniref:hypothetical protein n=1 Tax=Kocuria sp. HSID16901 TaxID=2419505 RepID=UPI000F875D4F|nr:hypothetical protein [Kocuria sp. HSID16901]RUQ22444.1 hypothetical protein D8M21_03090 [Kocuria sp. HSID16901]
MGSGEWVGSGSKVGVGSGGVVGSLVGVGTEVCDVCGVESPVLGWLVVDPLWVGSAVLVAPGVLEGDSAFTAMAALKDVIPTTPTATVHATPRTVAIRAFLRVRP